MLDTQRRHADRQLTALGESDATRDRLAEYCEGLADRLGSTAFLPTQDAAFDELDEHRPAIEASLTWLLDHDAHDRYLSMCAALRSYWYVRAHYDAGRRFLLAARDRLDGQPALVHGRILQGLATLDLAQLNIAPALEGFLHADELLTEGGAAPHEVGLGLFGASTASFYVGDPDGAAALQRRALDVLQSAAPAHYQALAIASAANLAYLTGLQGDLEGARAMFDHVNAQQQMTGVTWYLSIGWLQRGAVEERFDRLSEALSAYRTSRDISIARNRDLRLVADAVAGAASVAWKRGDVERAALLLGAEASLRNRIGGPIAYISSFLDQHTATRAGIESALAPDLFAELLRDGAAMTEPEVDDVLAAIGRPSTGAREARLRRQRTEPRKQQVLTLVAQGLSDKEIAAQLELSERTIQGIVSQLRSEFGTTNRAALAAEAIRRGLV
jgi:DNA-binding CsgD family transcriptional regulator